LSRMVGPERPTAHGATTCEAMKTILP
jgi:hypothetical protein